MPKIDKENIISRLGTDYPAPFDTPCVNRMTQDVSDTGGLSQFGVKLITLPPGVWSSQRHHHSAEDEFVYIISGHPTFIDDAGAQILSPGDMTTHPAGDSNGHHMKNETDMDVTFIVVGSRQPKIDNCHYPDIDLALPANGTPQRSFQNKAKC
ncbi:MAG: cupin domain-containing protein [Maricaulaceae bacterium]